VPIGGRPSGRGLARRRGGELGPTGTRCRLATRWMGHAGFPIRGYVTSQHAEVSGRVFRASAEGPRAAGIPPHCPAGKDRTGFACALILHGAQSGDGNVIARKITCWTNASYRRDPPPRRDLHEMGPSARMASGEGAFVSSPPGYSRPHRLPTYGGSISKNLFRDGWRLATDERAKFAGAAIWQMPDPFPLQDQRDRKRGPPYGRRARPAVFGNIGDKLTAFCVPAIFSGLRIGVQLKIHSALHPIARATKAFSPPASIARRHIVPDCSVHEDSHWFPDLHGS